MSIKNILLCVLLAGLCLGANASEPDLDHPSPEQILKQVDAARLPWSSVRVNVSIEEFRDEKRIDSKHYQVLYPTRGQSLVRFMDARERGQYLLMREEGMWLYFPNTRRALRITPIQRLSGNASNGDLAELTFGEDYSLAEIANDDPEHPKDRLLELTANKKNATYARILLWVDSDGLARQAYYFLASGKHLKTVQFDAYVDYNGAKVLSQMTLSDPRKNDRYTRMTYKDFSPEQFPQRYFRRAYLPNLRFVD